MRGMWPFGVIVRDPFKDFMGGLWPKDISGEISTHLATALELSAHLILTKILWQKDQLAYIFLRLKVSLSLRDVAQ